MRMFTNLICSHLKRALTWQRRRWHDAHSRREGIPLTSFTKIVFLLARNWQLLFSACLCVFFESWTGSDQIRLVMTSWKDAALPWSCDLVTAVYGLAFCFSDTFPMVSEMSKISKGEWLDWKPGGDWCVKLKPAVGSVQHSWKKSKKYNRQKIYKSTIFVSTARKLADQSWKIARRLSADFPNCLVQQEWRGCWAAREGTGAKSSVSQQLPKLPSCVHCALSTLLSCVNIEHIDMHKEASCADNIEKWTLASAHRGKDCQKQIGDSGANFSVSQSGNCSNCVHSCKPLSRLDIRLNLGREGLKNVFWD